MSPEPQGLDPQVGDTQEGTQVVPVAPGAPGTQEEPAVEAPPLEELSPTERHLESLNGKLATQRTTIQGEKEKAQKMLDDARERIDALKRQIKTLKTETLSARDTMNQATGLAYALRETVKKLRQQETGEREGGGVGELRILMQAEVHRARELAVALVGESPYTDEFLKTATIDEGKAGGLAFEIKNDFRKRVSERLSVSARASQQRVPRNHPDYQKLERAYQDAEDAYRNASSDLVNAENRRDSLLEQVKHSLSTLAALNDAVEKADRVAVRIEEQGTQHEREDLMKASGAFNEKTDATRQAESELQTAQQSERTLQDAVTEFRAAEERITETIEKVRALPGLRNRAIDLHKEAPGALALPLLRVKSNLERMVLEAKDGIDPTVVQIAAPLHGSISYEVGHGAGSADSAYGTLEKAVERLQELLERLDEAVEAADKEGASNLNWGAIGIMLERTEELDQFLKNAWPRLAAGTPEGVAGIAREARSRVEKALEPLTVLRRAYAVAVAEPEAPAAPPKTQPRHRRGAQEE